jgi:hypothetical protein
VLGVFEQLPGLLFVKDKDRVVVCEQHGAILLRFVEKCKGYPRFHLGGPYVPYQSGTVFGVLMGLG